MGADRYAPASAPVADPAPRRREGDVNGRRPAPADVLPGAVPRLVHPAAVPGRQLDRNAIDRLQHSHGNAFVGRLLGGEGAGRSVLQRHPEGTPMTLDPVEAGAEIANPPPLPAVGAAAGPETGDGAGPPATEAATVAAEETPAAAPAEGETAAGETSPAVDGPAPAPATPKAMDLKKAEEVLKKSYGSTKTIVPGSIVLLANRDAIWVKYDEVNKGRKNPYNSNLPWKDGDAKTYIPGLDGFAEKGTVYVNEQTKLATATAHEMLHNNTAAGFRGAVGETINEGATEYLAIKALKDSSVSTASGTAYPGEVAFVTKLVALVGEATLIDAYFNGAAKLVEKFDKLQGTDAFAKMKPFAEAKNWTEADKLVKAAPKAP